MLDLLTADVFFVSFLHVNILVSSTSKCLLVVSINITCRVPYITVAPFTGI